MDSNYDQRCYHMQYRTPPKDSSPNPELHDYSPEDPQALPQ